MGIKIKKILSFLLALSMMLQYVPMAGFAAVSDNLCEHHAEHTAECGYVEGESICTYHCDVCLTHSHDEQQIVCDCETDDEVHATTCPMYVAMENPQCYCVEKCTEGNIWCDVCGFDYTACAGEAEVNAYAASGNCGTGVSWSWDGGVLTISGSGAMTSFGSFGSYPQVPWSGYGINELVVQEGVTSVGSNAFYENTSLKKVTLASSVTGIGTWAFRECTALESVAAPGVKSLGTGVFEDCAKLKTVTLSDQMTSLYNDTFKNCTSLQRITLPSGLTEIRNSAFQGCTALTSIVIPDGVTSIWSDAFNACTNLTSLSLPAYLNTIGKYAFDSCTKLSEVNIGSLEKWCAFDFYQYGKESNPLHYAKNLYVDDVLVTDLVIPEGVETIGSYVLGNCTSIKSVTIPDGMKLINYQPFYGCSNISEIYFQGKPPKTISDGAFYGIKDGATAYYLGGDSGWTEDLRKNYGSKNLTWVQDGAIWDCVCQYNDLGVCTLCGEYQPAEDSNSDGYYEVSNPGQLFWFVQQENEDMNLDVILTKNIVIPSGDAWSWTPVKDYYNTFNGNGHSISGIRSAGGMFTYLSNTARVQNLTIKNSSFISDENVGAIADDIGGSGGVTVSDCHVVNSTVSGKSAGGILGQSYGGTIVSSSFYAKIENCSVSDVTITATEDAGGIVGEAQNSVDIRGCSVSGNVSGQQNAGGIIGYCWNDAGPNESSLTTVSKCTVNAAVSSSGKAAGGIVGLVCVLGNVKIFNCSSAGSVTCSSGAAGGILGSTSYHSSSKATVSGCYTVVTLSGSSCDHAIGKTYYSVTINNCYGNTLTAAADYKSDAQFSNGEVTCLLNNGVTDGSQVWKQTIGSDAYPKFDGSTVYQVKNCKNEVKYSNTDADIPHDYVNNICTVCGRTLLEYGIKIAGTAVTSDCLSGEDWSYDPDSNVLSLAAHKWTGSLLVTRQNLTVKVDGAVQFYGLTAVNVTLEGNSGKDTDSITVPGNNYVRTSGDLTVKKLTLQVPELAGASAIVVGTVDGSTSEAIGKLRLVDAKVKGYSKEPNPKYGILAGSIIVEGNSYIDGYTQGWAGVHANSVSISSHAHMDASGKYVYCKGLEASNVTLPESGYFYLNGTNGYQIKKSSDVLTNGGYNSGNLFEFIGLDHVIYTPTVDGTKHNIICACASPVTIASNQAHTWTYQVNGDTITAICNPCKAKGALKLIPPTELESDGQTAREASIENSIPGMTTNPTIVYAAAEGSELTNGKPVKGGTYTASISLGNKTAEISFTLTSKHTLTITADPVKGGTVSGGGIYTQGAEVVVSVVPGEGYSFKEWNVISGNVEVVNNKFIMPANDVKIEAVFEHSYCYDKNSNHNCDICDDVISVCDGGTATCMTQAVCAQCNTSYGSVDLTNHESVEFTYEPNNDGATHTKKHTCCNTVAVAEEAHNHENGKCICGEKATPDVTAPTAIKNLVYTGAAQKLVSAGTTNGGEMQYKLGEEGTYGTAIPTATNAGTYTVYYKVVGDDDYNDVTEAFITVTIGDCIHAGNSNKDDNNCATEVTCSVCGDVLIAAKAHVWGDWSTTKAPTTTAEGIKERPCTNAGCQVKDTGSIPMLNEVKIPEDIQGGDIEVSNPAPATGEDVTITVIPETGKIVEGIVVKDENGEEVPATKNLDGTYTFEQPAGDVTIEAVIKDVVYTVTWFADGRTYKQTQHKYSETISAPADPVKAQVGCTSYIFQKWNGYTAGMKMPDNQSLSFTAIFTEGVSHTGNNTVVGKIEASCGAEGYTGDTVCECGVTIATGSKIPATGKHSWKNATCADPKICKTCGATEGKKLGHSWKNATCTDPKTCKSCGVTEGKKLGHSWKDATCTNPKTCKTCGATEGKKLGHSWKDATCTNPKTCKTCGVTEGKKLNHTYTDKNDATCNRCGYTRQVEQEEVQTIPVYRLYNPYTYEHLLTGGEAEKDLLISIGWSLDGVAWKAPVDGIPVYRLYNPYDDWHTYTISEAERDTMVTAGWTVDGVVSFGYTGKDGRPIYRLFNPYVQTNFHLFTAGVEERDMLVGAGWILEGVAWHAVK